MVAPSGEQYVITGGGYRAVVTECGGGLRTLEYDGRPLVDGFGEAEMASGGRGQLLAPWPNRIRDGRYTFAGKERQLALSEPARGNASHGLARWASWTVEERTDRSVSLLYRLMAQSGYPWSVDLHVLYDISADGLTVTVTATNLAAEPAPYALGAHPYLRADDDGVDAWELTLPAATRLLTDERKIPVGREAVEGTAYDFRTARPVKDLEFDSGFTDLLRGEDGRAVVEVRSTGTHDGVQLWMDAAYGFVQVYTGDDLPEGQARRGVAVEPMTAPANAFVTGESLVALGAAGSDDETFSASWGIRVL
jgi:aldose 1-epimerase